MPPASPAPLIIATRLTRLLALLVTLASLTPGCSAAADPSAPAPIRVAAAADLTRALDELGRRFEAETGHALTFTFGSTGLLAHQLREGAPFDLFFAASRPFADAVVGAGACDPSTVAPYALGRLALWSRARPDRTPPSSLAELADPQRFRRIAIANPEHAPYGVAAREALTHAGLLEAVSSRLVLGDNVRQALQFAETGNADAAIVALALVIDDRTHPWTLIDEATHGPIEQTLVVCHRGQNRAGALAFARYVTSATGRALLDRYGFGLPGASGSAYDRDDAQPRDPPRASPPAQSTTAP